MSKLIVDCLAWRCGAIAPGTLLYYIFHKPPIIQPGLGFPLLEHGDKPARKIIEEVLNPGGVLWEVSQYCPTTVD